eukprot:gene10629-3252_t
MKLLIAALTLLVLIQLSSSQIIRASCESFWNFKGNKCSSVQNFILGEIKHYTHPDGKHKNYTLIATKPNHIHLINTTPVRKYIDDINIEFTDKGDSCATKQVSRSRVFSVYDYSTNFCNIHNLLLRYEEVFNKKYDEKLGNCRFHDVTMCKKY